MFGISGPELLVIAAVTLVVTRPTDLPRMLRGIGRQIRALQRMAAEFQRELAQALHDDEVADLRRQAERAGTDISKSVKGVAADVPTAGELRRAGGIEG
jgi:Tat protein translocase TatB subunit